MKTPLLLSAVVTVGLLTGRTPAAETKGLEGTWEGPLKINAQLDLRFILRVSQQNGALKATLDSPDEGLSDLVIDPIALNGTAVSFELKKTAARFKGTINKDQTEIKGDWEQRGQTFALSLKRVDPSKATVGIKVPAELAGVWEGKLQPGGGIEIRMALKVEKDKQGNLIAALASPDQGANHIPISAIDLKDGVLTFESKVIGAKFSGKKNDAGTEFEGEFKQAGATLPLKLKKADKLTEARRPQTPKPPFPYAAEDVSYENKTDGVKLAGTLTIPQGKGPFPVVLLITGSGAQDRDETIFAHKPFLVLADYLTRRGIAVLRLDDRGVGGSTGKVATSTSENFANDVLSGVTYLKSRKEIDPRKIGLAGHSEGGIIAPMVASRSKDIAFIVLMAGTGLPGAEILHMQRTLIYKAMGATDDTIRRQNELSERLIAVVTAEKDPKVMDEKLATLSKKLTEDLSDKERKELEAAGGLEGQLKSLTAPWFRYFLTYDPRPALKKVVCPVLALNGEKDLQVPPKENLEEIEKALKTGGNARVTVRLLPDLNHLFQTSKTGAPNEYGTIEETIAPAALTAIGDWIVEQTSAK
jgi:pimeloyl-ACP methyl ester carboxylesterase